MKVLFLFTGGTIGSTVKGDFIGTDHEKPYLLLEAYRARYGIDFAFDTAVPYTNLSENNTGETLRVLQESVARYLDCDYDGIVVTHGTDTLQYSAAALSYALPELKIPVMLVSSNQPIENPEANGIDNLRGALRFIAEVSTAGVFVSYKNGGEALHIHRGTRLQESPAFSDSVYSIYNSYYGSFTEGEPFLKNPDYAELPDAIPAMGPQPLGDTCPSILRIAPYPGNPYAEPAAGVRYILHSSYHSGTINTASSHAKEYFVRAKAKGIITFLTGVAPGAAYDSTRLFEEFGIYPLHNIAPIAAFVKLWMWTEQNPDKTPTREMLQSSLAGDVVPQ